MRRSIKAKSASEAGSCCGFRSGHASLWASGWLEGGVIPLTCLPGAGETVASEAVLALALEGAQTIEAAGIDVTR